MVFSDYLLHFLKIKKYFGRIHQNYLVALLIFEDVLLRTRRVRLLYKVYGNSTLLVLNRTSLNTGKKLW